PRTGARQRVARVTLLRVFAHDLAQAIAKYFDFVVDYARQPRETLRPYVGGRVNEDLTLAALMGTGFAVLVGVIAGAAGFRDRSAILAFLGALGPQLLPVVVLAL